MEVLVGVNISYLSGVADFLHNLFNVKFINLKVLDVVFLRLPI